MTKQPRHLLKADLLFADWRNDILVKLDYEISLHARGLGDYIQQGDAMMVKHITRPQGRLCHLTQVREWANDWLYKR